MPLVDESGNVVDPSQYPVRTPAEVGSTVGGFLKRAAGPIAAQIGGEMGGAAIGTALAPETGGLSLALPVIMGGVGAGAANIAAEKELPPEYGGDPKASKTSDFLYGALPSIAGRGIPAAVGSKIARRAATQTAENAAKFDEAAKAAAEETHGGLVEGVK